MFSSTTTASSTTSPTASVSASSVMLLRLKPRKNISASVPMMDTGSDSAGIAVAAARCRKMKITITTSATVSISVRLTSCTASRIDSERSLSGAMRTEPGSCASSFGSAARMASTTATVLPSAWRNTASTMERSPLTQLPVFRFSTLSSTVATSARRTTLPCRCAIASAANSAALRSWRLLWMVRICAGPSSVPSGVLTLAARTAVAMSSSVRSSAASFCGSGLMRTA